MPRSLCLPEVKRGLIAGGGGAIRLPRQMPMKIAMEALLTDEPISPQHSLDWGLVNRVVPAGEALSAAMALAELVAANVPLSDQATKRLAHHAWGRGSVSDRDIWRRNATEVVAITATSDAREGATAFAERRAPHWVGS